VLVGEAYWRRAVDIDFLVDEGVIASEDREFVLVCRDGSTNLGWHLAVARLSGEPLHAAHERAAAVALVHFRDD